MELLVWILIAGLVVWFVLIPALALWIAVHVLGEEEDAENSSGDPQKPKQCSDLRCFSLRKIQFINGPAQPHTFVSERLLLISAKPCAHFDGVFVDYPRVIKAIGMRIHELRS